MGNYSAKERNGAPGASLDLFQTPPTSPQTPVSPGNAPPLLNPTQADINSIPDRTPCPDPANTVIGPRGRLSSDKAGSVSRRAPGFPISPRRQADAEVGSLRRSLTETTPLERLQVTGSPVQVDPPTNAGDGVEQGLLQECVDALGLDSVDKKSHTLTDLLKCFLMERKQMKEDLKNLMEKIQAERSEWLQFQSDLQVALVVADRLRAEAEEELTTLREARQDWEKHLASANQRHHEAEDQLEHLKAELEQSRQRQASDPPIQKEALLFKGRERGAKERCLQSAGSPERGRGEGQKGETETGITERSRSLSRLPSDSPNNVVNGISQKSVALTTRSVTKNNNPSRERLHLDQQDHLINLCKDKKEENSSLRLSSSPLIDLLPNKVTRTKPPHEDLNTLLRRHGGSKRNSLLRWCQNRTQGYPNIEITNFSSSWVDGLAFCAVYHSYLPSHIPYSTLNPETQKENLLLAFQTGEGMGITTSLTVEEMMKAEGPDWQKVLGYVESIYRHFEM